MFTPDQLQAFKAKIDAAHTVALFGHHNIDGDAIGSVLGLARVLEKLGKNVTCFTTQAPGKYYSFVSNIETIKTTFDYGTYDLIGFLDFTGYGRIKGFTVGHESYFDNANIIVVDHHIDDPDSLVTHALKLKDEDASSNCELLLEICHALWPELIDSETATHWYMGLLTDTGKFEYQGDSVKTFGHAMQLISYNADHKGLMKYLFNYAPTGLIDLMKLLTPRITFSNHICYIWYSLDEINKLGIDNDQAEAFMIFIRSMYGVPLYVECKVEAERIRFSLRSGYTDTGRINVQPIAKTLGGGGHMYASGCVAQRNPDIALEEQIRTIISQFNQEVGKQL